MRINEDYEEHRRALLVAAARGSDTPAGFFAFYELVHGHRPPWHVRKMIESIYAGKAEDRGTLIFAFRGSWKTTSVTVTFTAFRIGQQPERANLVVCVNDDTANMVTKQIADIIQYNPVWKEVFPNVVPDESSAWGAAGYEVKVTMDYIEGEGHSEFRQLSYDDWKRRNVARKDPTLLGMGYKSNSLIGKHPDGVLIVDDIHNEENTSSIREMNHVLKVVQDTLFPVIVEDPTQPVGQQMLTWNIFVGTPWNEDDVYHFIRKTGEFHFVRVPAMYPLLPGDVVPGDKEVHEFNHQDLQGSWVLNWPERFDKDTAVRWYNKVAKRGFWRMFLLDLTGASEFGIRYYSYPHEQIDLSWPIVGGVDYASVLNDAQRTSRNRSFFAMYYGAKLPNGGIVIVDGIMKRVMQHEAERYMEAAENLYPGYQYTVFEADGKGEEALAVFQRNPNLHLHPVKTGGRGKSTRLDREMSPWIENGSIRISDADTPALNALRKALDDFPNSILDPLDAVYWVMQGCKDALHGFTMSVPIGSPSTDRHRRYKGETTKNPYALLGRR